MATLTVPLLLWVAAVAAVVVVDVTGYVVAASRAQAVADAAALAAVADDVRGPRAAATRIADAAGASLERCDCGGGRAEVAVGLPVPGLVIPRLGARKVVATARAGLVRPGW